MILVNKPEVPEEDFISLLEATKTSITASFNNFGVPNINGVGFEGVVFNEMVRASSDTLFQNHIEQTGILSFPDIIAKKLFGVEVKMTEANKWVSTGNSVLETTRVPSVETIYMFFGKFGKPFDIKYRRYQECLCEVGVTHSPRYKIDMDLPAGASIFDKIGVPYDEFRKELSPIKTLKEYYRRQLKPGEELWWIDPATEEKAVSPVIKPFRLLEEKQKEHFIVECMILFPEVFGGNPQKFERPATYLITNYNAISSNFRDIFTAGGQVEILIGDKYVKFPKITFHLFTRAKELNALIAIISIDKLSYYWNNEVIGNPIDVWVDLLSLYSLHAVDAFYSGLK